MSLIVTRKVDQGMRMWDETGRYVGRVFVYGVERDRVMLGFEVDRRFVVLRDELVDNEGSPGIPPLAAKAEAGHADIGQSRSSTGASLATPSGDRAGR